MLDDADPILGGELRDELVRAMQRVPELAGAELTLRPLSGGITNRNFLVEPAERRDRYVIRLAGNDTHLLGISREGLRTKLHRLQISADPDPLP